MRYLNERRGEQCVEAFCPFLDPSGFFRGKPGSLLRNLQENYFIDV